MAKKDWMYKQKGKRSSQLAALLCLMRTVTPLQVMGNKGMKYCPHDKEDELYPFVLQIWQLWAKHCCDREAHPDVWQEWCMWCAWMLRILLGLDGEVTVENVIQAVRCYVPAAQKLLYQVGQDDEDDQYPLTDQDWTQMGNAAIATFLYDWMANQEEMRQSIYRYAREPFGGELPPDDPWRKLACSQVGPLEARENALRSAFEDLRVSFQMRVLQAEEEERKAGQILVKSPNCFQLPYPVLLQMEFIARTRVKDTGNCFRIFKMISQRKNVMKDERETGTNESVEKACAAYNAVLEEIAQWEQPAAAGDVPMAQKYVIGSLMAKETEEAYRLHFVSAMAGAAKRKGTQRKRMELESEIAQQILGRNTESLPHDPMTYKDDIACICSADQNAYPHYVSKRMILRREQTYLCAQLNMLLPAWARPKWTEDDYRKAAAFFGEKYNIINKLRSIPFPAAVRTEPSGNGKRNRKGKDHYDRMREYYEMIIGWREQEDTCFSTPYETYCQVRGQKK